MGETTDAGRDAGAAGGDGDGDVPEPRGAGVGEVSLHGEAEPPRGRGAVSLADTSPGGGSSVEGAPGGEPATGESGSGESGPHGPAPPSRDGPEGSSTGGPSGRRRRLASIAALLLVALLVGAGALLVSDGGPEPAERSRRALEGLVEDVRDLLGGQLPGEPPREAAPDTRPTGEPPPGWR